MLNPVTLLTALLMFVLTPAPTPRPVPQDQAAAAAKNPTKPTPASQADAKKIYSVDCAMCHGDNGNGKTDLASGMQLKLDDWTDPKSLSGKSDQDLFNIIRNGKDKMPPEAEGRAKDTAVWNLIFYIRKMSESPEAAPAKPGN
jgi:cytochrome c5